MASEKPKRAKTTTTTLLDDGNAVVFCEQSNLSCTLSPIGAVVWEFCDGTRSVDEIVAAVQAVPELASRTAQEQVVQLLNELTDSGLIE